MMRRLLLEDLLTLRLASSPRDARWMLQHLSIKSNPPAVLRFSPSTNFSHRDEHSKPNSVESPRVWPDLTWQCRWAEGNSGVDLKQFRPICVTLPWCAKNKSEIQQICIRFHHEKGFFKEVVGSFVDELKMHSRYLFPLIFKYSVQEFNKVINSYLCSWQQRVKGWWTA